MKYECWLPCSQQPVTCPYPEPAQSNPRHSSSYFLQININIILPSMSRSSKCPLSRTFSPPISCMSSPYMPHASPIHSSWLDHLSNVVRHTATSFACDSDNHFCNHKAPYFTWFNLLTIQTSCCNNPVPSANQPRGEWWGTQALGLPSHSPLTSITAVHYGFLHTCKNFNVPILTADIF